MIDFSVRENDKTGLLEVVYNGNEFGFQKVIIEIGTNKTIIDNQSNPVLLDFLEKTAQCWIVINADGVYECVASFMEELNMRTLSVDQNMLNGADIYRQTIDSEKLFINDEFYTIDRKMSTDNCLFLHKPIVNLNCVYKVKQLTKNFSYLHFIKRKLVAEILNNPKKKDMGDTFLCIDFIENRYVPISFEDKRKIFTRLEGLI